MELTHKEYKFWFDYVVNLLSWRFTIPPADTKEDIAQEILIKVLRKYEPREGVTFKTFVYHVTKNTVIDCTRKKRLAVDTSDNIELTLTLDGVRTPSIEDEIICNERNEKVIKLLDHLTPMLQGVMQDRYILEMKYEEIAKKRGYPIGSVKASIHRARKQLKEKFDNSETFSIFV